MFFKQFGGKVTKALETRYQQSPNWQNGSFQNLEETEVMMSLPSIMGVIYKQLASNINKAPTPPIPILPFDKTAFLAPSDKAKFIWYGHSVVAMHIQEMTFLIDPMLGPDTTPIAPIANKRFSENTLPIIDDLPEIDLILLTHDHYDHLDYASIQKLKHKTKLFFVALGLKRHLVSWGVKPDLIVEFDWWDTKKINNIEITFTPTRHFSGRGLTDRQKCLWGGWVFKTISENIWFSGDGGYGQHFKTIGERLGPFDFAFMECGQYNDAWRPIHLFPDESVQAAIDAKVKKAMPVHWAGFSLSFQHTWSEPADQFAIAATDKKLPFILPALGQQFDLTYNESKQWWG